MNHKNAVAAMPVPASMAAELMGYTWTCDVVGESGSAVYRLQGKAGSPDLFLKYGKATYADDISNEMVRLRWLAQHLPVPTVINFTRTPGQTRRGYW